MRAFELTTVANAFSQHAETLVALRQPLARSATHSFWLTNRFRNENWSDRLAAHREAIQKPGVSYREACWREITPVIEEVLLSEPLVRCLAYHATVLEQEDIDLDFAPLAQSTLAAQVEARHRCLHLIVFGTGLPPALAARLNRLRRTMELFNDQLLALMRPIESRDPFCFHADSLIAAQAAYRAAPDQSMLRRLHANFWLHRLRWECKHPVENETSNSRLNANLAEAVLEMLPSPLFDGFGLPVSSRLSIWQSGLNHPGGTKPDSLSPQSSPIAFMTPGVSRREVGEMSDRRF